MGYPDCARNRVLLFNMLCSFLVTVSGCAHFSLSFSFFIYVFSRLAGRHHVSVKKPARDKAIVDTTKSYSAGRFGNLPFTPQWGLTDSSRMDNSRDCHDMLANLLTLVDDEFLNECVPDIFAINQSWRLLCQSMQQQSNVLLCFESLSEEHANLVYAHESCKEMKARYKKCKKEMGKLRYAYDESVYAYDQLLKYYDGALNTKKGLNERVEEMEGEKKELEDLRVDREKLVVECGNREMVRHRIINEYHPTFVRQLHQSAKYKRALGEVFSLAVGKGFIDGISIDGKEGDIQAILVETPNLDPAPSATFMEKYEKLVDKRYPYVNKVASAYLRNPSELQNVMPDETSPTPGQGPRATLMVSYA
ncbi:hypothetical protein Tco_0393452 [Tanacetum coccineum]